MSRWAVRVLMLLVWVVWVSTGPQTYDIILAHMCRVLYSDNSESLWGQLCWLPSQQSSLFLDGVPTLSRWQLLHRAISPSYSSSRGTTNWCHGKWFSLALIGSSIDMWLDICQEEGSSTGKSLVKKKCIHYIKSHWKEKVSLFPVNIMSRCSYV